MRGWRTKSARPLGRVALACALAVGSGALARAAEPPLSLAECVQRALEHNPTLASLAWRTEAASAARDRAAAERWPRVDLALEGTSSARAQRVAPPSYLGERIHFDQEVVVAETRLTIPVYQGGALKARLEGAGLALSTERQVLAARKQGLILDVLTAYTRIREQRAVIQALDASVEALQANLDVVRALEEVGRVAHLDALKVDVRVAALVQQASAADRDLANLRVRLGRLMGRAGGEAPVEISSGPIRIPVPSASGSHLVSIALEQRPEIRAQHAAVGEARTNVRVARSLGRPQVRGVVAYTFRGGVPWTNLDDRERHVSFAWGGVALSLPLWTGGRTGAAVAEALARQRAAETNLEALRLLVREQLEQALTNLQEASDRLGVADAAVGQAREALAIEQSSYEIGRAVVNDVLDAQAALLGAQLDEARARADVVRASAEMVYAAGDDLRQAIDASGSVGS